MNPDKINGKAVSFQTQPDFAEPLSLPRDEYYISQISKVTSDPDDISSLLEVIAMKGLRENKKMNGYWLAETDLLYRVLPERFYPEENPLAQTC